MAWFTGMKLDFKKTACAYLLERYLGQFFEEKITKDQLTVDLYNGTGSVENIILDVLAINEVGEEQNWPVELIDGRIDKIYLKVPWTSILKESCYVEVTGLQLTLQPKQRNESAASMFESMWNSMTSSMQLAEECAKQDAEMAPTDAQPFEGIEDFAQTIDSVLNRVKVKFVNTVIQIEHVPKDSITGVGLSINIDLIDYSDDSGKDPTPEEATELTSQESKKTYLAQSFSTKQFVIQGVSLSTVEFASKARTFSRSVVLSQSRISSEQKHDSIVTVLENSRLDESSEDDGRQTPGGSDQSENDRHVILFGKFYGSQEVRVRLKQSENIIGPKISIEANFGPLIMFLSPRQLFILLELGKGFATPENVDTSNVAPRNKCKPLTALDYQRIEQDLQYQLQSNMHIGGGLQTGHAWSGPDDDSQIFYEMKRPGASMYDSSLSGVSSSLDSSTHSSVFSSVTDQSQRSRRRLNNIDTDISAEISHFQINISTVATILLHEDILVKLADHDYKLSLPSIQQMQQTVTYFFDNLGQVVTTYGTKDFYKVRNVLEKACKHNHLRLLAAPVQIEGDEKTTLSAFSITAQISAVKMELLECLYNSPQGPVDYIPLLKFEDTASVQSSPATAKSSFKMNLKHIQKTARKSSRRNTGPRTEIALYLGKCTVDLDISIADRIMALLDPPTICVMEKRHRNIWDTQIITDYVLKEDLPESRVDLKIVSPSLNIKLRFPIPDFRPPHDMNRIPWWKRHVRPDYISLVLYEALVTTSFVSSQIVKEYCIQSRGLDIVYYENEDSGPLPIGKAGFDERYASSMQDALLQSRLTIKVFPENIEDLEDQHNGPELDPMTTSCYGAFVDQRKEEPSPFSAKKVVHESDTPHDTNKDASEELLLPGDKKEIEEFVTSATANCKIHLDIFLPMLSLHLPSKHIYEVIYNRINNDLLLWESSAPKRSSAYTSYGGYGASLGPEGRDVFRMCKSGNQYESESESEDDSEETADTVFYSTYDPRSRHWNRKETLDSENKTTSQSFLVLNIQVGRGLACINPPVREASMNNVIPGQQAEFLFSLEDANLFMVSGYKGNRDLNYLCMQVHNSQVHHCQMITVPNVRPTLKEVGSAPGRHLHPTIYKSESGMLATARSRGGNHEMLTVAMKIQQNSENENLKNIQLAVGINKATLRHRMCEEPNSWFSQLLDFFNARDYPIPGYYMKEVVIELHVHLWDCSIDYRPLHLPIRSAITFGSFSISSTLSAQSDNTTLRFIFEECALFLSDRAPPRNGVASSAPVDLKRDYVSVIDLGLFELSLKTNDKKSGVNPHIDLRASNDILRIHTCADSGRVLMQLITYIAENGDIPNAPTQPSKSPNISPKHKVEQQLIKVEPQNNPNDLTEGQQELLSAMLEDAMKESESDEDTVTGAIVGDMETFAEGGAKVFFFPDEHQLPQEGPSSAPLPLVIDELGNAVGQQYDITAGDSDGEFCIIDAEAELGILPNGGMPEVVWLSEDAVRVMDNYLAVPEGRPDVLKTPDHFPTPTMRYTLCEMTVVWQMYGGNDFKVPDKESKKKTVNFSDMPLDEVSFSNRGATSVNFMRKASRRQDEMPLHLRGGVNRNHSVLMEVQLNKVRFVHEIYPETTKEASRQVLSISEVEIRDRLECSQINMFLYEYISEALPKQNNSKMVVVKAVHVRPDPKFKTQECILKVSVLPLRLNIDQDSLLFLISYFQELVGGSSTAGDDGQRGASNHGTPTHQPPVLSLGEGCEELIRQQAKKVVNENLMILIEENRTSDESDEEAGSSTGLPDDGPIYFRSIVFYPEVFIRLDYHGKRIDMTHGSISGLLMGLAQLNCSELVLKSVTHRQGLLGFEKLVSFLMDEWLTDIKTNQLQTILGGVGPMYSVLQLLYGVKDLFWMPIEQYQKDGRIVRGLQKGANSFTTSTARAALELTSRVVRLIQITAETAYDMLSPGPSVRRRAKTKRRKKRNYQPQDIREGMTNAINVVREGIGETSENIMEVVSREKEQKGYSGMVGGVLRQIPPTILTPVIIATEATSNVLGGVQSQFVPDARREAHQKWRCDDDS